MGDWSLTQNTVGLIWLFCGVVLFVLEFVVPGVILVFFGVGAVITAVLVWLGVITSLSAQLLTFCVISLLTLVTLRQYFSRALRGKVRQAGEFDDNQEFIGARVRVCRAIEPGSVDGRVFFEGAEWKAVSDAPIAEGKMAQVVRKENITLHVVAVDRK